MKRQNIDDIKDCQVFFRESWQVLTFEISQKSELIDYYLHLQAVYFSFPEPNLRNWIDVWQLFWDLWCKNTNQVSKGECPCVWSTTPRNNNHQNKSIWHRRQKSHFWCHSNSHWYLTTLDTYIDSKNWKSGKIFSSKLGSFCTETFRNSSEDTKNVIFVNCAEFESANFLASTFVLCGAASIRL